MSYIKEPIGVDFFVKSTPLTNKDRLEISSFIKASKANKKKTAPSLL